MKLLSVFVLLFTSFAAFCQTDSTKNITISGFVDAYYAFDFNKPQNHERPGFLYNHNRHNEFNVNLALLQVAYTADRVRGNLAVMAGTYTQYNLAAEPSMLKNIYEASVGVRLGRDIWLDAGIFPSHIGVESAISKDNYTLTRSLAAENSPYYESGVKVTYAAGSKWVFTGLVLNGWQNIQEPAGNSGKAIGTQIQFRPTETILLNSSSFVGNEKPDDAKQRRYFHNFYATFQLDPTWQVTAVFDIGAEEKLNSHKYNIWYTPVLLLHYRLSGKAALGARAEYYCDKNGVIINSGTPGGFKTSGYSLNLDYAPTAQALMRLEGRLFNSKEAIFIRNSQPIDKSTALTASAAISF